MKQPMKRAVLQLAFFSCLLCDIVAQATVRYVDINNPHPAAPYADWSTAANVIQVAIDAADPGDLVLVTNGVYQSGGHNYSYSIVSRVAIPKLLTVMSVNGPAVTTILGDVYPHYAWGCRCAWLTNGAVLSGFTLTLGNATLGPNDVYDRCGGGVYCMSYLSVVSNCVVVQNRSSMWGGGAFQGTYINCLFSGNSSGSLGGGAAYATLINCTVVTNSGASGGGVGACTVKNGIVYANNASSGPSPDWDSSVFIKSCTTGISSSGGNITADPLLVNAPAGDFHLGTNSPCINAGDNAYAPTAPDLDGNPRIVGGTVDMGAYEFQSPASLISYAWLQQYGLPVDGSADFVDTDSDGMNNWQEWVCDTDPTNATSFLQMLSPTTGPSGTSISWQSVGDRAYFIQRATDLSVPSAFQTLVTNVPGQAGTTTFIDTNTTGPGPYFYRVGVWH